MNVDLATASRAREGIKRYAENVGESACACLIVMVQGNVLILSLNHWLVAAETGLASGTLATLLVLAGRISKPWVISAVLGVVTVFADLFVHSDTSLAGITESLATGIGAAVLCFIVTYGIKRLRRRRVVS